MTKPFQPHEKYMRMAIDDVMEHFAQNVGGPFGACIVKDSRVISLAHNTVLTHHDPTCHAEINAIRQAASVLKSPDFSGCVIYSTTEPCPMCFSAIHWAKMDCVIYGSSIADVKILGFNELEISNQQMKSLGNSSLQIIPNFMQEECIHLLKEWQIRTPATTY